MLQRDGKSARGGWRRPFRKRSWRGQGVPNLQEVGARPSTERYGVPCEPPLRVDPSPDEPSPPWQSAQNRSSRSWRGCARFPASEH